MTVSPRANTASQQKAQDAGLKARNHLTPAEARRLINALYCTYPPKAPKSEIEALKKRAATLKQHYGEDWPHYAKALDPENGYHNTAQGRSHHPLPRAKRRDPVDRLLK